MPQIEEKVQLVQEIEDDSSILESQNSNLEEVMEKLKIRKKQGPNVAV